MGNIWSFLGNNAAEIIALSALFLALYQAQSTKHHNKLSVRPNLNFHLVVQQDNPQVAINLDNEGVGPAVIGAFVVTFDNEEQDTSESGFFRKLCGKFNIPAKSAGGSVLSKTSYIPAGDGREIFRAVTKDEKDLNFDHDNTYKELKRLKISVNYESIYGEKYLANFAIT